MSNFTSSKPRPVPSSSSTNEPTITILRQNHTYKLSGTTTTTVTTSTSSLSSSNKMPHLSHPSSVATNSTQNPNSNKVRQHTHLAAQLALLQAHLSDLENLVSVTAVQAEHVRSLGGYLGGLFMASSKILGEESVAGTAAAATAAAAAAAAAHSATGGTGTAHSS